MNTKATIGKYFESGILLIDPRLAKCRECKHSHPANGSGHHLECHAIEHEGKRLLVAAAYLDGMVMFVDPWHIEVIAFDPHGIENGWAMWPINFDPVWLWWCFMLEKKEIKDG